MQKVIANKIIGVTFPLLALFSFFTLSFFLSSALAEDFTIRRFHSDILIHRDSFFTVKETIEVEFHRPRHGLYREIPFAYRDDLGESIVTPMKVLSVTDASGKNLKTKTDNRNNLVHIRIGDPDKYVNGPQTYVIEYRIENALLFFDDHDELYWNVTGNLWQVPIKESSANVLLGAKDYKGGNLRAACYTGSLGSRETACRFETSEKSAAFFTKRDLGSGEGLTIAFGWDKGVVDPPSAFSEVLWKIKENWSFLLPVISLVVMINLWRARGRDPRVRESVTVMYQPPSLGGKTLSPAEAGALIDEKLDPRDITATIVGLAVKGYLKIEETKKDRLIFDSTDYSVARIKEPDQKLSPFETEIMRSLFTGSLPVVQVSDLKNKFYKNLGLLRNALYGELEAKKYFLKSPEKVRTFYVGVAVAVAIASVVLSIAITRFLFTAASFTESAMVKSAVAGLLAGLPVLAFSRIMPAKTKSGASALMDVLGFREFMSRAEKDRLERMADKDLFSRFLPYAIALDVVDNWAEAFEGIYQEPPQWYVSTGGPRAFSPRTFSRSITSATSSLATAMYSSPRGSGTGGSGGGGSSGGGFGGGGGGSW